MAGCPAPACWSPPWNPATPAAAGWTPSPPLKLRREGDILGASQSGGRSTLKLLRVLEHGDVIERARSDAQQLVAEDPELRRHEPLAAAIDEYLNPEKEAFLERG